MEALGVPTCDANVLVGEPRNPIAGTYRILLHRKHLLELAGNQEGRIVEPQERKKKISASSLGGGSSSSVNKRKISRGKQTGNGIAFGKPMSKICAIL